MVDAVTGLWPQVTQNVRMTITATAVLYDTYNYDAVGSLFDPTISPDVPARFG